jgi:hypothetical protein
MAALIMLSKDGIAMARGVVSLSHIISHPTAVMSRQNIMVLVGAVFPRRS